MDGTAGQPRSRKRDQVALLSLEHEADLRALDALASEFNLFEVIRATRRELTHSNVLGFFSRFPPESWVGELLPTHPP